MKKSYVSIGIFYILIILILTSCYNTNCITKDQFIESYSIFIKELDKNDVKGKSIEYASKEFDEYSKNCYNKFRNEMTLKERKDFWSNTVKYYLINHDNFAEAMNDAETRFSKVASEDFDAFLNSGGKEISNLFKVKLGPKLKDAINQLFEETENAKRVLKKEINNLDSDLK